MFMIFFFVFVNKHGALWGLKFQNTTPPTNGSALFQTSLFLSPVSSQSFWDLTLWILTIVFSFALTWDYMALKFSKCYSHKSRPNLFKPLPNFTLNNLTFTKLLFRIFKYWFIIIFFQYYETEILYMGVTGALAVMWNSVTVHPAIVEHHASSPRKDATEGTAHAGGVPTWVYVSRVCLVCQYSGKTDRCHPNAGECIVSGQTVSRDGADWCWILLLSEIHSIEIVWNEICGHVLVVTHI